MMSIACFSILWAKSCQYLSEKVTPTTGLPLDKVHNDVGSIIFKSNPVLADKAIVLFRSKEWNNWVNVLKEIEDTDYGKEQFKVPESLLAWFKK